MTLADMLIGCGIMFAVTFATKAVGLLFVKKQIKNQFIKSFLYYLPYSVLAVMVFPAILFSTSTIWSGIAGTLVALVLAYFRRGLLVVSVASIAMFFLVEMCFMLSAETEKSAPLRNSGGAPALRRLLCISESVYPRTDRFLPAVGQHDFRRSVRGD